GNEGASAAEIYREVRAGAAFQEVRRRYRRFVVPACALFLTWYLAYVVAATTAPALMARPVFGPVNVALLAGLGQFASTFVLTWAYARHARLRRDRLALDLRWETQQLTRGARG
ncbi:membrane protein, partial [Streptomyces sp. NRRL WC-3753]